MSQQSERDFLLKEMNDCVFSEKKYSNKFNKKCFNKSKHLYFWKWHFLQRTIGIKEEITEQMN